MKNDFYDIAYEDLQYLQATLHLPFYNNIAVASKQIAEKMLKSVVESKLDLNVITLHQRRLQTMN